MPDDLLEKYDKISERGHFALYRNTKEIRVAYRLKTNGTLYYKDVYSSPEIFGFDESWYEDGINHILLKNNYRVMLRPINYADILVGPYGLRTIREIIEDETVRKHELSKKKIIYLFRNGTLIQYCLVDKKIVANEELYIHLHSRRMINKVTSKNSFLIIPRNRFVNFNIKRKVTRKTFVFISEKETIFDIIKKKKRFLIYRIKKMVNYVRAKLSGTENNGIQSK